MNSFIIVCQNDSFLTKKIHVSSVVLYWCSSLRDADWYFWEISWNKAVAQPTAERCTLASTPLLLLLLLHPLNGLFSRTTRVSRHQKRKTSLDLNEARDDGVLGCSGISWTIYKQSAPRSRQITTPTPYHSIFTGRMLFPTPNQQFRSTEDQSDRKACMLWK